MGKQNRHPVEYNDCTTSTPCSSVPCHISLPAFDHIYFVSFLNNKTTEKKWHVLIKNNANTNPKTSTDQLDINRKLENFLNCLNLALFLSQKHWALSHSSNLSFMLSIIISLYNCLHVAVSLFHI